MKEQIEQRVEEIKMKAHLLNVKIDLLTAKFIAIADLHNEGKFDYEI